MESNKEYLSLKVLRLTKPTFNMDNSLVLEQDDLGYKEYYSDKNRLDLKSDGPISDMLGLPVSFGNIYLGETFTSYITLINDGNQVCRDVIVKAHIQTATQQLSLVSAYCNPVSEMQPGTSLDDIISHEIKELGNHILICSVNYLVGNPPNKCFFKKFYKFQVGKPLDVKTKFFPDGSNCVYMEAQIQNITSGTIYLERVALESTNEYKVEEINCCDKLTAEEVSSYIKCLKCTDISQFLYKLSNNNLSNDQLAKNIPSNTPTNNVPANKIPTNQNIGRLDIVWRTSMGEKGRLQTSTLSRPVPTFNDIKFVALKIPNEGIVGEILTIQCQLENVSERNLDLIVSLHNYYKSGIMWTGTIRYNLGTVIPKSKTLLDMQLMPISPGLHTISGLKLTDTLLRRDYEQNDIGQIFILIN